MPLLIASFTMRRNEKLDLREDLNDQKNDITTSFVRNLIFSLGVLGLLFVPIF